KGGAAAKQRFQSLLQARFSDGIDGAGGFVEDNNARVGEQCSSEANQLPLAERKRGAFFSNLRFESAWECFDYVEAIQCLQTGADFGFRGLRASESDVVEHRAGKEEVALLHVAHFRVQ